MNLSVCYTQRRRLRYLLSLAILTCYMHIGNPAKAQECSCSIKIPSHTNDIDGNNLQIRPGDKVCLEAGTKPYLRILNLTGTKDRPIIIQNCGGKVIIENTNMQFGIKVDNSKHFILSGTGDPNHSHGIKVNRTADAASGVNIGDLSTDFEVKFLEITHTGFAGIMAKTDPRCDGSANRGNFVMKNVSIHDNLITNVKGEGLYIGNSFYTGRDTKCNNKKATLFPHDISGLKIYNNTIKNTGWDGLQVGCAVADVTIHDNFIENYGTAQVFGQNTGIQINPGTTGKLFNNTVIRGTGAGIVMLGTGNNLVFNNIIAYAKEDGIYCDDRSTVNNRSFDFINNTIVSPGRDGIRINSTKSKNNKFINNIVASPGGNFITRGKGANLNEENNLFPSNIADVRFENHHQNNFQLTENSPAINNGSNVSKHGVVKDFNGGKRPSGGKFDIGAHEYGAIAESKLSVSILAQNPVCFGTATGQAEAIVNGGKPPYHIEWSNGSTSLKNNNLEAGNYEVRVTDTNGSSILRKITIVQPHKLSLNKLIRHPSHYNKGSITTNPTGGVEPYKFEWSNGSTQKDQWNLNSGSYLVTMTDNKGCSITETILLSSSNENEAAAEIKSAIEEGVLGNPVNAFPNPFQDKFTIEISDGWNEEVEIKLFDQFGNIVYQDNQLSFPGQLIDVELASHNLAAGIYILHLNSEHLKNRTIKLLKQ
jgi:hypothetical protein